MRVVNTPESKRKRLSVNMGTREARLSKMIARLRRCKTMNVGNLFAYKA